MIDDKKIEEAAFDFNDGELTNDKLIRAAFIYSAKWMQEEFLKNLWHPASEEPRKDVSIIVETYNDENMFYYAWNRWQDNFYPSWTYAVFCSRVTRWLYIDDLFSNGGCEHD